MPFNSVAPRLQPFQSKGRGVSYAQVELVVSKRQVATDGRNQPRDCRSCLPLAEPRGPRGPVLWFEAPAMKCQAPSVHATGEHGPPGMTCDG